MADEKPRDDDRRRNDDRGSAPRRPHGSGRNDGRPPRKDDRPHRSGDRPSRTDGKPPRSGDRPYGKDDRRPPRSDGKPPRNGDRPYGKDDRRPPRSDGKPPRNGDRPYGKDDRGFRKEDRGQRGSSEQRPQRSGRPPTSSGRAGKAPYPAQDDRRGAANGTRPTRPPQDQRISGPDLPDDVTPRDLHGAARGELKTLSKENADTVARHLVMAARLIDEDPEKAHAHALAASRSAGRVGVVRETVAITAYAMGDFALALRELRTYRRISGKDDQIALMVDSERGVGRPDRAIEAGRSVDRSVLDTAGRVQLAIAMSGARLDLGQTDRALLELEIPEFDPNTAYSWSADLFAARANVLEELGRETEAAEFRRRADLAESVWESAHGSDDVIEVDELDEIEEEGAPLEPIDGAADTDEEAAPSDEAAPSPDGAPPAVDGATD